MSQPNTPREGAQDALPPSSTNAAAQAYQQAMQKQSTTPSAATTPAPAMADIVMSDSTPDRPAVCSPPAESLSLESMNLRS